jgi:hypothetical protein
MIMGIFGNLTNEGLEEAQDRIGGGGFILDTDIYNMTVKMAYATKSAGGAHGFVFIGDNGGKEYRETLWVTNKKGENFFLNKDDKTKKVPLPGFTIANDICLATTEKPLSEQATEEKIVNIYDFDQKKEIPTSVPVLVDLLGQPVTLAILKILENKSEKVGDDYVPTAETREVNQIDKVFHTETQVTMVEARNGQAASFYNTWLERNKGQTRDKRSIKDGSAGTAGRPGGNAGAPTSGAPSGERKSLFGGNKS